MTDSLTVPTHFGDLSELSAGLADRVDEERIILYGPDAFDEGAMVAFAVLLVDGTPALEGVGRVAAAVDGGEARAPETRFDIVFDTLQLEGRSEVVYERIVLHRQSMLGGEPPTGEVDVSELEQAEEQPEPEAYEEVGEDVVTFSQSEAPPAEEPAADYGEEHAEAASEYAEEAPEEAAVDVDMGFEDVPAEEAAAPEAAPPEEGYADEGYVEASEEDVAFDDYGDEEMAGEGATMVASMEQIEQAAAAPPSAPPPELPEAPEGFALPPLPEALTRPVHPPTWWPAEVPPAQPRASSGWFQHGGDLPVPGGPPRPELHPSQVVSPAPRPGAEAAPNMPPRDEEAVEAAGEYEESAHEDVAYEESAHEDVAYDEPDAPLDQTVEAPLDEGGDGAGDLDVGFDDVEVGFEDEPVAPYDEDATAHEVSLPEADPFEEM